ncbi:cytochrome c oxidase subunit 4 [Microterricola pindariensis]|uniref:Cytochrome c oxidase polypeptide 4 n=1 Tax=Microterricola pindariensis TaxID=478010 RepID=A0ABX5ATU2_9MICO|nr:cytochrome c oxidase subunit 4 [Microterricola pindariensis]PPL16963.1 cytochrome c oxidase subunit IV [Microterricola pindariensis]
MRVNSVMLWILTVFFALVAVLYGVWTAIEYGHLEWVGTIAIALCGVLTGFVAFYLDRVYAAQGGELPEDRLDSNIDDGDAELGFFSPWSWWPIMVAASLTLFMLGLAAGFWMSFIAVGILVISLVGWVYEYYRGLFAR